MKNFLDKIKLIIDKLDNIRDQVFFALIKPFWPKFISPNYITVFRIILSFSLFSILFFYKITDSLLIMPLFLFGAFTDLLDGSIARAFNKETKFGVIMDPIADRMLVVPIAVYSLMQEHQTLLFWFIILEVVNGLTSLYAMIKNVFIKANTFGKLKMFLQCVVFIGILFFWPKSPHVFFIYALWLSIALLIISIFYKIIEINVKYANQQN